MSLDFFLVQQLIIGAVALLIIAAAAIWATRQLPGREQPAAYQETATLTITNFDRSGINREAQNADSPIRQAAEAGDRTAQYQLGLAIMQRAWERGNQSVYADAADWIRKAAGQNHIRAQFVLGMLYEKGRGVIQNYAEAVNWYQRAAQQGDALSMARLGQMYKTGHGVEKNLMEAYAWLNLAAARGDQYAEVARNRMRDMLPPEHIAQAQARSQHFDQKLPRLSDTSNPLPLDF